MSITKQHIVIAGAGPSGCTVALGLKKLGFIVTVISTPRLFNACEGISERTYLGLKNAGLIHAINTIHPPSQRTVNWNNTTSSANTERLIKRQVFDAALKRDLYQADITVISGRLNKYQLSGDKVDIEIICSNIKHSISADFLVDSRGRSASAKKTDKIRGPETISLIQHWEGKPCETQSSAVSFKDGWAWLAQLADGSRYTQITVDANNPQLKGKENIKAFFFDHLNSLSLASSYYKNAEPKGDIIARSSTAILNQQAITDSYMRVGDAALAVDPLSGNGLFQSLSTALIAPSIINTILNKQDNKDIAKAFYSDRVKHAFMRFARMGRDFYKMESQWIDNDFWLSRSIWPDNKPMHQSINLEKIQVQSKPVIDRHFINIKEVVVTNDQPLGIWKIDGFDIAPIVKSLKNKPLQKNETLTTRLTSNNIDLTAHHNIASWLSSHGLK